ncbi:hypothetical protein ES708_16634 [subsurface metagenome]
MTIDEAIKTLSNQLTANRLVGGTASDEAQKLGIEALKRCKTLAENSPLWQAKPLPGETKD